MRNPYRIKVPEKCPSCPHTPHGSNHVCLHYVGDCPDPHGLDAGLQIVCGCTNTPIERELASR